MAAKKATKATSPHDLAQVVRNAFGKYSALVADNDKDSSSEVTGYFPTGIDVIDHFAIGAGGFPQTKMSEVYGEEGTAKSSLGLATIAVAQRQGAQAVLLDAEHTFDKERAIALGVDVQSLVIAWPEHLEQLFEAVKLLLASHAAKTPMLIVWDSVAATNTKAGLGAVAGSARVADVALLMSQELRKLLDPLADKRAHLMMINQVRSKLNVQFGNPTTTPGGNAAKFYSYVRLWIGGGLAIRNRRGDKTGKVLTIFAAKNKCGPPHRKVRVRFDYATGFNDAWSTIHRAIALKLIDPRDSKGKRFPLSELYHPACKVLGFTPRTDVNLEAIDADDAEEDDDE